MIGDENIMKGIGKRTMAVLLSLVMLLTLFVPSFAADDLDFQYEVITNTATVSITGYTGSDETVVIPDSLAGRRVVEIGSGAFARKAIKKVVISSNVQRIRDDAFHDCSALQSVSIPASVTAIGNYAFAGCVSLTELTIASASTIIGYSAFEGCTALQSVTLPSATIREAAFRNCTALETIELKDSVQSVGRYAFDGTAWLNAQPDGLITLNKIVYSYTGDDTSVEIPEDICAIADYAFSGSDVETVILPDGLYYIGIYAFYDCRNMTYLSVPASVISIGTRAIGYTSAGVADFTVYAFSDSIAAQWAANNALTLELIDDCTHDFSDWVVSLEPTCTTDGTRTRRCPKCNASEEETIEATGHVWSGWTVISELSCTEDGVKRRTCTVCGATDDEVTEASGHVWSEWKTVKNANCTQPGVQKHTCAVCRAEEDQSIEPTGHRWQVDDTTDKNGWKQRKAATCTEPGENVRVCAVCQAEETAKIEPLGHTADEWTVLKDATPVTPGEREGVCTRCGASFTETIPIITEELPDDVKTLSLIDNASIAFNDSKTCLLGVVPGSTVNDVLLQFQYPGHILVTDISLQVVDGESKAATGYFLFLVKVNPETNQEEPIDTTCIIITGDVDGDGDITAADARRALRISASLEKVSSPFLMAADLDGDKSVTASEARKILRVASRLDVFQ